MTSENETQAAALADCRRGGCVAVAVKKLGGHVYIKYADAECSSRNSYADHHWDLYVLDGGDEHDEKGEGGGNDEHDEGDQHRVESARPDKKVPRPKRDPVPRRQNRTKKDHRGVSELTPKPEHIPNLPLT